jgi:Phospholipase_D-nuclease N-terminal
MVGALYFVGLVFAVALFLLAVIGVLGALAALALHLSGLLVLALDVYAVFEIVKSNDVGVKKAIWILMIFFLPVLGLVLWYFLGRKKRR